MTLTFVASWLPIANEPNLTSGLWAKSFMETTGNGRIRKVFARLPIMRPTKGFGRPTTTRTISSSLTRSNVSSARAAFTGISIFYSFADNHDVDRVASTLTEPRHLYPLYLLLLTMPGVPSLYYGSEWGITGRRTATSDGELRPALCPKCMKDGAPHPALHQVIRRLLSIRREHAALRRGEYNQLHVNHEQFAFMRGKGEGAVIVAVNSSATATDIPMKLPRDFGRPAERCLE